MYSSPLEPSIGALRDINARLLYGRPIEIAVPEIFCAARILQAIAIGSLVSFIRHPETLLLVSSLRSWQSPPGSGNIPLCSISTVI